MPPAQAHVATVDATQDPIGDAGERPIARAGRAELFRLRRWRRGDRLRRGASGGWVLAPLGVHGDHGIDKPSRGTRRPCQRPGRI